MGKPQPGFCAAIWGYSAWLAGVSGIVIVEPSTTRTLRLCHSHSWGALRSRSLPVRQTSWWQAASGWSSRAVQYAPVSAEHGRKPLATRQAINRATAGMIHAQALGKKHPDGHGRRVMPPLPKPSCRTEGFENTLFGQERSKQQRPIPSRLRDRRSKRTQHLGLLARGWTCL